MHVEKSACVKPATPWFEARIISPILHLKAQYMPESAIPLPASIVTCRNRQWVVLPSENQDVIRLRPLSGNEDQIGGIYLPLELETIKPAVVCHIK